MNGNKLNVGRPYSMWRTTLKATIAKSNKNEERWSAIAKENKKINKDFLNLPRRRSSTDPYTRRVYS